MPGRKKPWIITYTTEKEGECKRWGMYITADDIISAIRQAEKLIQATPEEYDRYIITDAGIATDEVPTEEKWRQDWDMADPEDF